jgi:hypothetical protein
MRIERNGNSVVVDTPYHPGFPQSAKALGGKWDPAARIWRFDSRDEERVRVLVSTIFGDPDEPQVRHSRLKAGACS